MEWRRWNRFNFAPKYNQAECLHVEQGAQAYQSLRKADIGAIYADRLSKSVCIR